MKTKSKLLIATGNKGKVREYTDLLRGLHFELVTPGQQGITLEVDENGVTYEENARIKAEWCARSSGLLTLADDSGLEVDALGGEPGIRSSRYAGEGASDADRVNYLLSKMKDVPAEKRAARFKCVIAIAIPDRETQICSGQCEGVITFEPRGANGFGYDPVFYFPEYKRTMAELPEEIKNRISHRARAAQQARPILEKLGNAI
jgi:XTP/dITP diphosphohydrolase